MSTGKKFREKNEQKWSTLGRWTEMKYQKIEIIRKMLWSRDNNCIASCFLAFISCCCLFCMTVEHLLLATRNVWGWATTEMLRGESIEGQTPFRKSVGKYHTYVHWPQHAMHQLAWAAEHTLRTFKHRNHCLYFIFYFISLHF